MSKKICIYSTGVGEPCSYLKLNLQICLTKKCLLILNGITSKYSTVSSLKGSHCIFKMKQYITNKINVHTKM
jgi:hypothetical protein